MFQNYKKLDLTQKLDESVPTWTGRCNFSSSIKMDYDEGCKVLSYHMLAGIGTHMDAPSHFIRGGKDISDIPIENFLAPIFVIDVSEKSHPDYFISKQDLLEFEKNHQKISPKSFVIGYTGWQKLWDNPAKYRGEDAKQHKHFPGFSDECAQLLVERDVVGIGIDTLSPDGSNESFPVHETVLGADKYIVENLTNLDKLPKVGAYGVILPAKVLGATELIIRAVALIPIGQ